MSHVLTRQPVSVSPHLCSFVLALACFNLLPARPYFFPCWWCPWRESQLSCQRCRSGCFPNYHPWGPQEWHSLCKAAENSFFFNSIHSLSLSPETALLIQIFQKNVSQKIPLFWLSLLICDVTKFLKKKKKFCLYPCSHKVSNIAF